MRDKLDKLSRIDLSFTFKKKLEIASLFAIPVEEILEKTPKGVMDRAQNWINSPRKQRFEVLFAKFAMFAGVDYLANRTMREVYREADKGRSIYTPQVGYPGDSRRFRLKKIRTMAENADEMLASAFDYPHLLAQRKDDNRVLNDEAARARRFGFDELFQIEQVAKGDLRLFGTKALALQEIEIVEFLSRAFAYQKFDTEIITVVSSYLAAVDNLKPNPSLINPHTTLGAKDLKIIPRLAADRLCMERESLLIDFRMAARSLVLRVRGVGAE